MMSVLVFRSSRGQPRIGNGHSRRAGRKCSSSEDQRSWARSVRKVPLCGQRPFRQRNPLEACAPPWSLLRRARVKDWTRRSAIQALAGQEFGATTGWEPELFGAVETSWSGCKAVANQRLRSPQGGGVGRVKALGADNSQRAGRRIGQGCVPRAT